jgi:hypothetical protein
MSTKIDFVIAFSHLRRFKEERSEFLKSIVTDVETWVYHSAPQTKQAGMLLKQPTSPRDKKLKLCQSAG